MPVIRLETKRVEKPWGRRDLWPGFDDVPAGGEPVGEIWFQLPAGTGPSDPDLLVKYLFTAERLSVQVHPTDEYASARGFARGKSEAWQILSAAPEATIAIGMQAAMTREQLHADALSGQIVERLDWKPVKENQFWYSSAGVIHAIGPGLILVEIQQNADLTYRLHDYGSDRELHIEDGIAVASTEPYRRPFEAYYENPAREILSAELAFVTERWKGRVSATLPSVPQEPIWLIPLKGTAKVANIEIKPGGVWLIDSPVELIGGEDCDLLLAYSGSSVKAIQISSY